MKSFFKGFAAAIFGTALFLGSMIGWTKLNSNGETDATLSDSANQAVYDEMIAGRLATLDLTGSTSDASVSSATSSSATGAGGASSPAGSSTGATGTSTSTAGSTANATGTSPSASGSTANATGTSTPTAGSTANATGTSTPTDGTPSGATGTSAGAAGSSSVSGASSSSTSSSNAGTSSSSASQTTKGNFNGAVDASKAPADYAAYMQKIESELMPTYGDSLRVEYLNNQIIISVWENGLVDRLTKGQSSGTTNTIWNSMKVALSDISTTYSDGLQKANLDGARVHAHLLNEKDLDKIILAYTDGKLVHDGLDHE